MDGGLGNLLAGNNVGRADAISPLIGHNCGYQFSRDGFWRSMKFPTSFLIPLKWSVRAGRDIEKCPTIPSPEIPRCRCFWSIIPLQSRELDSLPFYYTVNISVGRRTRDRFNSCSGHQAVGGVAYFLDRRSWPANFPYPALDWRLAM